MGRQNGNHEKNVLITKHKQMILSTFFYTQCIQCIQCIFILSVYNIQNNIEINI